MKILLLGQSDISVPPVLYGGSERVLHHLCSSLAKRKYTINLLAGKYSKVYGGRTLEYFNYRFGTSFISRCYSWCEFQAQCIRLINGVDLIHSFSFWPERLFFLNKTKIPIIYRQGNPPSNSDFKRIIKNNSKNGYLQCISNDQINKIDISDENKAFVTHNCVDTEFFKPGSVNRKDYLLFLGRLNYNKGVDIAVRISKDTGIPLKIAGPVPRKEKFAQKFFDEKVKPFLNNQIEHVGEVNDFQKRSLILKAKALIVPNRWEEPFGIVNIEALACGVPVIATNRGSLKEIVKNKQTGFLCNNYEELLEAVKNLDFLNDSACRKDACDRFSVKKYINDNVDIYQNILRKY